MLQSGDSTVRLAEIARQSGHAVEAVNELWPLVARLEARAAEGHMERDSLILLAQARVALSVSLGTVLPEERLASAARWTGQAVKIATHLDDPAFHAHTLRMHGNELHKAGHIGAAIARLEQSLAMSYTPTDQGATLTFLCGATGELGDGEAFDSALGRYQHLLERNTHSGLLFQPFTLREIEIRGLLGTGRAMEAGRLADLTVTGTPSAPQWRIIERVTVGKFWPPSTSQTPQSQPSTRRSRPQNTTDCPPDPAHHPGHCAVLQVRYLGRRDPRRSAGTGAACRCSGHRDPGPWPAERRVRR